MTSPPDVQNVPDVWGLLEEAYNSLRLRQVGEALPQRNEIERLRKQVADALAKRERFVLVPRKPTTVMMQAGYDAYKREYVDGGNSDDIWSRTWDAMLAAAPKPEGKP